MCRYFSVSDKELKEERAKLHKKMVRFTDERLGLDDEISVLKKRIYEIDVNLGVCLFDDFGV
jgi:predicted  nucleic acid-binding Zn-ribbon protein